MRSESLADIRSDKDILRCTNILFVFDDAGQLIHFANHVYQQIYAVDEHVGNRFHEYISVSFTGLP